MKYTFLFAALLIFTSQQLVHAKALRSDLRNQVNIAEAIDLAKASLEADLLKKDSEVHADAILEDFVVSKAVLLFEGEVPFFEKVDLGKLTLKPRVWWIEFSMRNRMGRAVWYLVDSEKFVILYKVIE